MTGNFSDFIKANKNKCYSIAEKNTARNLQGRAVISKEDEWRNESEWDTLYNSISGEQNARETNSHRRSMVC